MKGRAYSYSGANNLVKSVTESIADFTKKFGYAPSLIEIRDDEYDPTVQRLPIKVLVVQKTIQPGVFILYPLDSVTRKPILAPKERKPV
jgi:hypothetical protein